MSGPLQGVRVLDLSRILSGPFCTMLLADLGAEVVKVEQPLTGDPARYLGPRVGDSSAYFISVNRGKMSVTLNFFAEEGGQILRTMVPHFDILVENFVPGTMARLGLDYATLKAVNQHLIYASISGFGQDGPYARRPALDIIVQAMGGIMSVTGEPGGPPIRPGISLGDSAAGLFTALTIVSALYQRGVNGQGQYIDMSMLDCQVTLMENPMARYFATGQAPGPLGSRHPAAAPFQAFQAQDGDFAVALLTDDGETWRRFCSAIGRPDLGSDPRFQGNQSRVEQHPALATTLQETFRSKPIAFWLEALSAAAIPCGPVNGVPEVVDDPQVYHRSMVATIPHRSMGTWRVANTPFRLAHGDTGPAGPAPELGEHTQAVLSDLLGVSEEHVSQLRTRGII